MSLTVGQMLFLWLEQMPHDVRGVTRGMRRGHVESHLIDFFHGHQEITTEDAARYTKARLKKVVAGTVKKELSTLRSFIDWAADEGHMPPVTVPPVPKRAKGTPHPVRRRGKPTDLSPEECRGVIYALPEWAGHVRAVRPFPVRARFGFMYETAARPALLDGLLAPEHYSKGRKTLTITPDIDKGGYGREVPLTTEARRWIDLVCPDRGPIFGRHNYRELLSAAAAKVLPPHKAKTFCAYDLRHARATELGEGGTLTGVGYLLGHKRPSTTDGYMRPNFRAAERMLNSLDENADDVTAGIPGRPAGMPNARESHVVRRRGLEPPRRFRHQNLNPESSRALALNVDPVDALYREADAILTLAANRGEVDRERLERFARAALDASDLGRLALAVLDGGDFAGARAVELAAFVVELLRHADCCSDVGGES